MQKFHSLKSISRRGRGRWAVMAAACAGIAGAASARADFTGFNGFAPVNTSGSFPTTPAGYAGTNNSTFNLIDGNNGETVSGFTSSPQLVTSFDAEYTVVASGTADGYAFVVQNQGTNALGGGGGSGGYQGITTSVGVQTEYYFATQGNGNPVAAGVSTNGAGPAFYYTGAANVISGQPIRATVSYYNNAVSYSFVDTVNHTAYSRRVTGISVPASVGANTAYVGFTGATGGLAAQTNISSFSFVSAPIFNPIALASSSFTDDMVVEKSAPQSGAAANITASMDSGRANTANNVWYEQGYNTANLSTGLPASGSTFTTPGDSAHTFTMQSYTANNALLVGANGSSSGTLTLTTPKAYRSLSLLAASGNGDQPMALTINYANGTTSTVLPDIDAEDWFNGGVLAWNAAGRVVPGLAGSSSAASTFNNVGNTSPNLWAVDVNLPDSTDPIASITVADDGGAGRIAIFALSGASAVAQGNLTYLGTGNPAASFDTSGSLNFQTNGTPVAFATGNSVLFDDTAAGSTTVTVQAAGVNPQLMVFSNNSKAYVFNGGPITALGATFNGSGSTTFNDTVNFSGAMAVTSGTVVVGSVGTTTGSLSTAAITIGTSGTLNISSGGTLVGAPPVIDNGILIAGSSTTVGALSGTGTATVVGTVLTAGAGTAFNGTFAGSNGTFNLSGGQYNVPSASSIYPLTGGINVGVGANSSAATLLINDNSGQTGQTSSGSPLTVTIGANGTLSGTSGNSVTWGGNIVLNASTGVATVATSGGGTFNIVGPITGTGPVNFAGTTTINGTTNTYNLNASSSYTGETRISQPPGSYDTTQVTLNTNNAISTNSGVNFVGGGLGAVVLEMNAYNQSVAYLTGNAVGHGIVTTALQNSAGNNATLTITNGNTSSGTASFGAPIQGNITILKTGTGNQIFAGSNTYNGTTTINGGTLTAANTQAFSNSVVTLGGGKLGLSGISVVTAPTITSFANFQTNIAGTANNVGYNGATLAQNTPFVSTDNSTLYITSNDGGEANSAFLKTPVTLPAGGFYANFVYQNDEGADGITFTLQNDVRGASAIGGTGGALGYSNQGSTTVTSISPSAAIQINIYGNGGTGFGTNGIVSDGGAIGNLQLGADTNPLNVAIVYNAAAQTVTETITDSSNGATGSVSFPANYASILGGTSAYVGFTGGTGGSYSAQAISNFSFGAIGNGPVSIANNVVTTSGTASGIELNVSPGYESASIGSLNITSGSKVAVNSVTSGSSTRGVLIIPSLTIASTGTLDIQNNDLDLPNTTLSAVTALVKSGYNLSGGAKWNGPGITSSSAAANSTHLMAVGVIANNVNGTQLYGTGGVHPTFDGSNPGSSDILVKYTYFGDANLDGKVDGSDYSLIDSGYAADKSAPGSVTGWYNGDFNYDGTIDGSDYALLDNAFNNQSGVQVNTAALVAGSTAQVAGPTAVPEPASIGLIVAGGLALVRRRRAR